MVDLLRERVTGATFVLGVVSLKRVLARYGSELVAPAQTAHVEDVDAGGVAAEICVVAAENNHLSVPDLAEVAGTRRGNGGFVGALVDLDPGE